MSEKEQEKETIDFTFILKNGDCVFGNVEDQEAFDKVMDLVSGPGNGWIKGTHSVIKKDYIVAVLKEGSYK